ncbi:MAG TPA: hypothetical protein VLJ17_24530 [Xanthobacteraceae bacterium]|nr:hypothetical protein [Xanthobacteraceae bacterium]
MADNPDVDDIHFFKDHPDRKAHIRVPAKQRYVDKQRAVHFGDECEAEFQSVGSHDKARRRIILLRSDHRGNLFPGNRILKIPFLLFADETVEDTDEVLLPICFDLMMGKAREYNE